MHRNRNQSRVTAKALARPALGAKEFRLIGLALLVVVLTVLAGLKIAAARSAPESFADLAEKSLPAVVNISTTQMVSPDSQIQDLELWSFASAEAQVAAIVDETLLTTRMT